MRLRTLAAALAVASVLGGAVGCGQTARDRKKTTEPITTKPAVTKTAVDPKPLSTVVTQGLAWLAQHQVKSGGWGQGDEAVAMHDNGEMRDTANVADSSMALLAFLRSGNTARKGEYKDVVARGVAYVLGSIEASDDDSLFVTDIRGTRVQSKIGQYADTFAALMMLAEARGTMPDGVANARVDLAIRKIVKKVEKNQRENGTWDDNGWAPVLTQAMAGKGLNRVAQAGFTVDSKVLALVEARAQSQFDSATGAFSADGAAGVGLYGAAANTSNARDSAATKRAKADAMREAGSSGKGKREAPMQAPDAPTEAQIAAAEAEATVSEKNAREFEAALIARTEDSSFIAGFGNNGGEEFLSHLLISESLVLRGGDEWIKWDQSITKLVDGIQNDDGSWTGHHCITGRTFCTAAALLVLLADRTPAPEAQIAT